MIKFAFHCLKKEPSNCFFFFLSYFKKEVWVIGSYRFSPVNLFPTHLLRLCHHPHLSPHLLYLGDGNIFLSCVSASHHAPFHFRIAARMFFLKWKNGSEPLLLITIQQFPVSFKRRIVTLHFTSQAGHDLTLPLLPASFYASLLVLFFSNWRHCQLSPGIHSPLCLKTNKQKKGWISPGPNQELHF